MMNRSEYWIGKRCVIRWLWGVLLGAATLGMLGLLGCGEHDRALVLSFDEDAGEKLAEEIREQAGTDEAQMQQSTPLYIHVCGAVISPGVVEVPEGSRVSDALAAAGGLSEGADAEYVNLAAKVTDGQQLYFPTREEAESLTNENASLLQQDGLIVQNGKINLNTADVAALCTLPGIGEARARDIIAYRDTNGRFAAIEDIMKVSGIKESVFQKLKDKISVN